MLWAAHHKDNVVVVYVTKWCRMHKIARSFHYTTKEAQRWKINVIVLIIQHITNHLVARRKKKPLANERWVFEADFHFLQVSDDFDGYGSKCRVRECQAYYEKTTETLQFDTKVNALCCFAFFSRLKFRARTLNWVEMTIARRPGYRRLAWN